MATFKTVIRNQRPDGLYPVYIRVTHNRRMGYIKTDKVVSPKGINKKGDIKDVVVNEYCPRRFSATLTCSTERMSRPTP